MSPSSNLLGEVEQLVLLSVLRLGDEAYAVPMRELIERDAGVVLSRGTMYVTLDRLERKGYVTSWFSAPQAIRGGKARRYYRVKPAGVAAMQQSHDAIMRLVKGTAIHSRGGRS
jgi:DNA-binding PadR family transcriptional regulator